MGASDMRWPPDLAVMLPGAPYTLSTFKGTPLPPRPASVPVPVPVPVAALLLSLLSPAASATPTASAEGAALPPDLAGLVLAPVPVLGSALAKRDSTDKPDLRGDSSPALSFSASLSPSGDGVRVDTRPGRAAPSVAVAVVAGGGTYL